MNKIALFVDDDPHILEALERSFHKESFRFLTADSGHTALELLAGNDVQVVISDEMMPGMSGTEFLKLVRKNYPNTIRMMLTGKADLESAVQAINEGEVYRYFTKPCDPGDLKMAIQRGFQHYELVTLTRKLLLEYRRNEAMLMEARDQKPEAGDRESGHDTPYYLEEYSGDLQELLDELGRELGVHR